MFADIRNDRKSFSAWRRYTKKQEKRIGSCFSFSLSFMKYHRYKNFVDIIFTVFHA